MKKMLRPARILLWSLCAITAATTACNNDDKAVDEPTPAPVNVELSFGEVSGAQNVRLEDNVLTVACDGASVTIELIADNKASIEDLNLDAEVSEEAAQWCAASIVEGKLSVTVEPFAEPEEARTAGITISGAAVNPLKLEVMQQPRALLSDAEIVAFVVEEQTADAVIDPETGTVGISVKCGPERLKRLAPTVEVSEGATVSPESGAEVDFTEPAVYTVTAEDGTTKEYTVTATREKNDEALLLGFTVTATPTAEGQIDQEAKTVLLEVPYATRWPWADNSTSTTYEALTSDGATLKVVYGDDGWSYCFSFEHGATLTVTSEDESAQTVYALTARYAANDEAEIVSLFMYDAAQSTSSSRVPCEGIYSAIVDQEASTITIYTEEGASVSSLTPCFTLSNKATVEPASTQTLDFSAPVVFTVTAEDGVTTRQYTATTKVLTAADLPFEMVDVEAGTFSYGDNPTENYQRQGLIYDVTLTRDYAIGKYEVTQELFEKVMGINPADVREADRPVWGVTWYEAAMFCNRLSKVYGLEPVYTFENVKYNMLQRLRSDVKVDYDHATAAGYRLPTDAEWEYAAKGGNKSQNWPFAGDDFLTDVAWTSTNTKNKGERPQPVGQKLPNELGLYDMSGNVTEWCYDWSYKSYPAEETAEPKSDPTGGAGPASGISNGWSESRAGRGGGYNSVSDSDFSTSMRKSHLPAESTGWGLRIVITK